MHLSARSFFPILSTLHSSDRWIFHRIFSLNVISLENSPQTNLEVLCHGFCFTCLSHEIFQNSKEKVGRNCGICFQPTMQKCDFPTFVVLFIWSKRNDTSFLVTGWGEKDSLYVTLLTPKIKLSQASQENVAVTYFCSTKTFLLRKSNENWACL